MPIIGLKISALPAAKKDINQFLLKIGQSQRIVLSLNRECFITEETDRTKRFATSRMLAAGADRVYWLWVTNKQLSNGFNALMDLIPKGTAVVCESESARTIVEPGVFLVIRNSKENRIRSGGAQAIAKADYVVSFDGASWDFKPEQMAFVDGRWLIRQNSSAIILAGGMSTRIGLDKSLLIYRGEPLIAHIARQLVPMFEHVVISTNEPEKFRFLGLPTIPDIKPGRGPLMGIASALRRSSSEFCFVVACDIPTMDFSFIHRMVRQAASYDIVMPRSADGRFEPLFAVYRRSVYRPALEILEAGGRRIVELFDRVKVLFMDFDGGTWYKNINTMADYLEVYKDMQSVPPA